MRIFLLQGGLESPNLQVTFPVEERQWFGDEYTSISDFVAWMVHHMGLYRAVSSGFQPWQYLTGQDRTKCAVHLEAVAKNSSVFPLL